MSELAASDSRYCLSHKFNTAVEFLLIETYLAIGKLWNELLNEIKSRGPRKKTMKEDLWKMIRDACESQIMVAIGRGTNWGVYQSSSNN